LLHAHSARAIVAILCQSVDIFSADEHEAKVAAMTEQRIKATSDPATDAAALILRLGMVVLAILIPCASVISRRPLFVLMPIGAVLVILGSRLAPRRRPHTLRRLGEALASPLGLATVLLVAWAGLSFLWTPFPSLALDRFLKTAGTVLLAGVAMGGLPYNVRASNSNLLPIGVAAAALALIVVAIVAPETARLSEIDTNTVQRATIGVVVLVWPALGALAMRERVAAAGIVAVMVAVAAVIVWLPSALAAVIFAILTFSFAYSDPARTGIVLGWLVAALIFFAPAIPLVATALMPARVDPNGALAVFPAWAAVIKSDGMHLITGHGFDSSVRAYISGRLSGAAPRGLLFEIWYELGIFGAASAAALAALAFSVAGQASRVLAPFLLAALACIFALGASGLAIAQLWWLTLLCTAAISFAIVLRGQHRPERVRAQVIDAPMATV
jgi:hypothetical protein